jgi:SAM-dependent methyltransferase
MKSHPYLNVSEPVKQVAKKLLYNADEYHKIHTARLVRTLDLLYTEIVAVGEGARVLELGTSGFLPAALKLLFPGVTIDVTNFDPTEKEVHAFRREFSGVAIDVVAYSVDLEKEYMSVQDGTYDVVVCGEVLEHMEIDPMFMLSEVNRVLVDRGRLLLTTPNVVSSRGITRMLSGYEPYFYMQYHKTGEYHRHNYEYSVHSAYAVLKSAGFDPYVWTEDLFEDGLTYELKRLNAAGFATNHVGDNIIALATKISGVVERFPSAIYV